MVKALRIFRVLPALALVFVQIAMAGSVTPVRAEARELAALAAILQVEKISLCNAGLQDTGIAVPDCPWCQGFGQADLPAGPALAQAGARQTVSWCTPCVEQADLAPAGLDYISRAPPV